jgi:enoyl-CoA hydratase/carnithine racemase
VGGDDTDGSVLLRREGAVATITLNRPARKNAVDLGSWARLRDALRAADDDPEVRAVVLTGAGGDFCAGADLTDHEPGQHPLPRMRLINETALAVHQMATPTIAKVRGVAVGAGWNLALGCDLVAAADTARFSQIFARRGLSLDFGGSWLLPRLVGMQQAKRLALLAEIVPAEEAHRLGLVTWLAPEAELDALVDDIAARLAVLPPIAVAQTKELLHAGAAGTLAQALADEGRAQTVNFGTDDTAIAFAAFRDRTEPDFTGRWAGH